MTKTTDKQLHNWLDHYKVDTSEARLSRLEDQIFSNMLQKTSSLFAPLNWNDKLITTVGVCSIAFAVLFLSQTLQTETTYSLASAYSYTIEGY